METSKLLDPNLDYFIIHSINGYNFNIEDQEHNVIGKIKNKEGFVTKHILLLDSTGSQICKLSKNKWTFFTNTYEVRDSGGKTIGIMKRKMFKSSSGMRMENSNGNLILSNYKSYGEKCTEIEDSDGKTIAKFCFDDKKGDFPDKYFFDSIPPIFFIQILDNSFDRKKLLSFFICLYNEMLEEQLAPSSYC